MFVWVLVANASCFIARCVKNSDLTFVLTNEVALISIKIKTTQNCGIREFIFFVSLPDTTDQKQ